jgi:hypothetical protein
LLGQRATKLGTSDPLSGFRLYRIAIIRDLVRLVRDEPLLKSHGTAADVELLLAASTVARRLESVATSPRYDLRQRGSRLRAAAQALAVFRVARAARQAPVAAK